MKKSSTGCLYKNQTLKAEDFPYPIERTASGTLYARLPNGQLVNMDKYHKSLERTKTK